MNACAFENSDVPGWLYCPRCQRYQQGASQQARRACRPELTTHKMRPDAPGWQVLMPTWSDGPGTELEKLLAEFDLHKVYGCKCPLKVAQMNTWQVEGCLQNIRTITGWIRESAAKVPAVQVLAAGNRMRRQQWFSLLRPVRSIVDEAIRRAAAKRERIST